MSTATKRLRPEALKDADDLRALFEGTYKAWVFAGSIRRERPEVGDVEHVILPRYGRAPIAGSMFGEDEETNLFLARCDELLASHHLTKHEYLIQTGERAGTRQHRWGEKYRGVDFRGFMHEFFLAEPDNWGAILCIRTGPAEFSERMVTKLRDHTQLEQRGGFVRYKRGGAIYPVRDEGAFFAACGVDYLDPQNRR